MYNAHQYDIKCSTYGSIATRFTEIRMYVTTERFPGYRFTKGLTQDLNLRTHLKLEYNIKSLNYIKKNFRLQAWFLLY